MTLTLRNAVLVIIAVDMVFLWPFAYRNGFGHGDVDAMQMALYVPNAVPGNAYGRSFSFGWYWGADALRNALSLRPEEFPKALNSIAVVASAAGDALLTTALALVVPVGAALLATVLWRFTPELWEVSTYGHPWTLAMPIFFAATAVVGMWTRRRTAAATGAILFFAAFAMRGDALFVVPVVLAVAWRHRREAFRPLLVASSCGALAFLVGQRLQAGSPLAELLTASARGAPGLRTWALNLGFFGYGAGLGSIIVLAIGGSLWLREAAARQELAVLAAALLPTFAFWIPIGLPARHFGPAYLVLAALVALVLTKYCRGAVLAALAVVAVIATNAVIAEAAFRSIDSARFQSLQAGESRRVMESVPLGNVWSNHQAQARITALGNAYASWALRCADSAAAPVFAAQSPYRFVMFASLAHGAPSTETKGVYRFGPASSGLWIADIPESGRPDWWAELSRRPAEPAEDVVLLGPRIPSWLIDTWQHQHRTAGASLGETPDSIAARQCPERSSPQRSPESGRK